MSLRRGISWKNEKVCRLCFPEDFIDLGNDFDMSLFRECYCGKFDSETDFAEEIVNSCYDLERLMGDLSRYFNYEAFADELFAYDYAMGDNGYVFRR